MSVLIIFNNPKDWPHQIPGVEATAAKDYLVNPRYADMRGLKVFNLCRSYRYQSLGYYVSLLAAARNHKAFPSVSTIQEMKSPSVVQVIAEDLEDDIQKSLSTLQSDRFNLSIYFGKNPAKRYDQLCLRIFNYFQAPLLRAHFTRKGKNWKLQHVQMISLNEIPDAHFPYVVSFAEAYFSRRTYGARRRKTSPYEMAILLDDSEPEPPSDPRAIQRFVWAAEKVGFNVEDISKRDYHRIPEFDALFIRATTSVPHYTFRFAQRAEAEGLVVIDDPSSILKCSNKVYLAELAQRCRIPAPTTFILNEDNIEVAAETLGFPMVLKQPDSSFSQGVIKVENREELEREATRLLDRSDLIIAQEFVPTNYDWRIGILDRKALYACKYFMAEEHWQILDWKKAGHARYGKWETLPIEVAPPRVVKTALRIANQIGDGLYGVDVKLTGQKCYLIEVNDNPSIEWNVEDAFLKDGLYLRIMQVFLQRVQQKKQGG